MGISVRVPTPFDSRLGQLLDIRPLTATARIGVDGRPTRAAPESHYKSSTLFSSSLSTVNPLLAHTGTGTGTGIGTGIGISIGIDTGTGRERDGERHQAYQAYTRPRATRLEYSILACLHHSSGSSFAQTTSLAHPHHRGLTLSGPLTSLGPWPSLSAHHFTASLSPRAVRRGDGKRGLGWSSTTNRFPIRASLSQYHLPPVLVCTALLPIRKNGSARAGYPF